MRVFLHKISEKKKFAVFRRKIIVFRSFMARAYQWIQVPGMILVMVGVIYPYLEPHISISIWLLAFLILIGMGVLGYLERYLGFFKEDSSYSTENNRLLLKRLDDIETKLDTVIYGKDGESKEKEKDDINKEAEAVKQTNKET